MNWKAGCGRTACPVWVEGDGQKPFSIHINPCFIREESKIAGTALGRKAVVIDASLTPGFIHRK